MYTDEEIRSMKKVTTRAAAEYLGISVLAVQCGVREGTIPIGKAVRGAKVYSYHIVPERLVAYKHGRLFDWGVQSLEQKLAEVMEQLGELKRLAE